MEKENNNQNIVPNDKIEGNKNANVPNLRFTNDIWKNIKLSECASGFEYGVGAEAKDFDGIHKYIRITDIDDDYNYFIQNDLKTPSFYEDKYIVKERDILLARTGASTGKSYLYDSSDGLLYFAGFLIRIHIENGFDASFIYQYTKSSKYKNWISTMSARSGQPGVNAQEYKNMCLYAPSYINQVKIGKFLTLVDKRIETQNKIIKEYETQRNWIINHIFGNINFSKYERLDKLCTITTGKKDANAMSENGIYKFFTCSREDYLINSYSFEGESLLISGNGELGLIKYFNGKFDAYQRTYVLQNFVINAKYIKFFLEYFMPRKIHKEKNVGAMPYIVLSTLSTIDIPLLDSKKIAQISKTIDLFDEKLQKEKDILNAYKKQKAYLLQNMFI